MNEIGQQKVTVSRRAIMQRINRVLVKNNEVLKKSRGNMALIDVGELYILEFNRNLVMRKACDLEELAQECEVLKPWEKIEGEE